MRLTNAFGLLLLLGSTAFAAIERRGTSCTVTPLSASPKARAVRRDEASPEVLERRSPASEHYMPGPNGSPEHYPRPEPGSKEAQAYAHRPEAPGDVALTDMLAQKQQEKRGLSAAEAELVAGDDTPQILEAFKQCGKDGSIVFQEGTYNIRQVMNTTDLRNCEIDIYGTFVWSADNLDYWIRSTFSVTYAGRSTAWLLGGTNVTMRGHGKALFNGNGQVWIDRNRGGSNMNGRPISLTVWHGTNIAIDGITWRQSQFWHTFVAHSQNVTMTNLDMNTTSSNSNSAVNTDGFDSWNSRDIFLKNWVVTCGDDCISVKGNSTNIHVQNVTCYESGCACIGSMGSNSGQPDYVDDVVFEDIQCHHSSNAAWIKTYPGQGHVRNVTFRNVLCDNVNQPIYITPCTYSGNGCDGSRLGISDISWINITGTSRYNIAAGMHCSSAAPCKNLHFEGIDIKPLAGGQAKVLCSNIQNQATMGWTCTGTCPGNWPQQLNGNR